MNPRVTHRTGWVKYGLLLALAASGAAGGFYLSGGWSTGPCIENPRETPITPGTTYTHRFPLSEHDAKDSVEAPALATDSTGRVYLTWASKTGEAERTLFLTRSLDGCKSFARPQAISKGGVFRSASKGKREGHERRATPHLAAVGTELYLAWSEAHADGARMRLLLATSTDAGLSFGVPVSVLRTDEANPTFTALGVGPDGALACAWLGSPAGQQPFAAVRRAGASKFDEALLVHAGQDGKGVCPCCAQATCFAPDGTVYVAFRNLADGYRDIAVGVLNPGQNRFTGPFAVVPPTWKFNGCPHDGPSLAVIGDQLHIVWMDARSGSPRCYHAHAKCADMKFTSGELHPIGVGTQGNAKLHADAAGRLHAVWEETTSAPPDGNTQKHQHGSPIQTDGTGGRAIQYAILGTDGRFGSVQAVAPRTGAFQTRPAISVTVAGRVIIAWNELDEKGKAVVVSTFDKEEGR